jgi:hypothetical protein
MKGQMPECRLNGAHAFFRRRDAPAHRKYVENYPTMRKREAEYRANALQACAARSNG